MVRLFWHRKRNTYNSRKVHNDAKFNAYQAFILYEPKITSSFMNIFSLKRMEWGREKSNYFKRSMFRANSFGLKERHINRPTVVAVAVAIFENDSIQMERKCRDYLTAI